MRVVSRSAALLALAALTLGAAGCGSNNKGKIEGKWKLTELPNRPDKGNGKEMLGQLETMGLYLAMEFRPDGTMTLGLTGDKPEMLEFVKAMAQGKGQKITWDAKYKLLSGDNVEFYDMPTDMQGAGGGLFNQKDRAKVSVKINGDEMTITDAKDTLKLKKTP